MPTLHTFKYLTEDDLKTLQCFVSEHSQYDDGEDREFWEEMANKLLLEQLHYSNEADV